MSEPNDITTLLALRRIGYWAFVIAGSIVGLAWLAFCFLSAS